MPFGAAPCGSLSSSAHAGRRVLDQVDAVERQLARRALVAAAHPAGRLGEVDRAVRLHDEIVRAVQALARRTCRPASSARRSFSRRAMARSVIAAMISRPSPIERQAIGADEEQLQAAVGILAADAVHIGAGEPALLEEDRQLAGGRPLVNDVRGHVAEQQIAAPARRRPRRVLRSRRSNRP